MTSKFQIETTGGLVAGYDAQHQLVAVTAEPSNAKTFATRAAAEKWLSRYVDAGYGLVSANSCVIEVTS